MPSSTNCSETRTRHADGLLSRSPALFGLAVFVFLLFLLGRGVLLSQDSPVFSQQSSGGVRILLGEGFPTPGVHQFSDGMTIRDVMELTGVAWSFSDAAGVAVGDLGVLDGMALDIANAGTGSQFIEQRWMPARQRLALGIPLHPDRMSRDDWASLPGIGEKLADRIEVDRQKYGDFGGVEALERVKGIGPAKLKALRGFFVGDDKL